jgi:hypothetical protein
MRKTVLILAVLFMTVPAMAVSNVKIYCDKDSNHVTLSYESDANLIRAFGLYITVDNGANITKVEELDPNYRIYPGQIDIEDGEVNEYNTSYDPCDLGDPNVTIEMGSLYTFDTNYIGDVNAGFEMQPGTSGTLLKFYVDNADCNYYITEEPNIGGIVMEDPYEEPNVTMCAPPEEECYAGMADYAVWVAVGSPECWCYPRQCLGDADGLPSGFFNYWVSIPDLNIMKDAWGKPIGSMSGNMICADFDHQSHGFFNYRVSIPDLNILKSNWSIANGPAGTCLPGNRNP